MAENETRFNGSFWEGSLSVTGLLHRVPPEEGGGWVGWCPEAGGVVTQWTNAVGTAAMLGDAIRVVIETSLLRSWTARDHETGEYIERVQRITHPNRMLQHTKDRQIWGDERWWPTYESFIARYDRRDQSSWWTSVSPRELEEGVEEFAIVEGHLEWCCVGGVILVDNPFARHSYMLHHLNVPAVKITAVGTEVRTRSLEALVRKSTFDPNDLEAASKYFSSASANIGVKIDRVSVGGRTEETPPDQNVWLSSDSSCPW